MVYEKAGKPIASVGSRKDVNSNSTAVIYNYKVNNTTYTVDVDTRVKADKQTSKVFEEMFGLSGREVSNGSAVVVGDTVYVYVHDTTYKGWYQAKKKVGMGAFVKAIS